MRNFVSWRPTVHRYRRFAMFGMLMLVVFSASPIPALAGGGPLGIDYRLTYDNSGIWARSNQVALIDSMIGVVAAGALWEGGDDRLGKTFWQSVDAGVISGVASTALK
jgi:hypothetical protein